MSEASDNSKVSGERTAMNALRRQCEQGTFPIVDPRQGEATVKTILKIMTESPFERNRLAAARALAALSAHNLKALVWLTRIDQGNLGGNDDEIVFLPDNGPWAQETSNDESEGTGDSDQSNV